MNSHITIIIPIYNAAMYLDRCISSVVSQSYKCLEVILLNDGSTDNSDLICRRWQEKDSRIIYIKKTNSGLGDTRNLGINIATGEYITFLDADDWIENRFIEDILSSMVEHDADIGLCDINYYDSKTGCHSVSKIRFLQRIISIKEDRTIINKARTFAWGKIYKKRLFDAQEIKYPLWTFEDIPCTPMLICMANKVCYVDKVLFNYWRNQNNSLSNNSMNISDIGKSLELLYKRGQGKRAIHGIELEIKKIMLGQVRFAEKRWRMLDEPKVHRQLNELNELLGKYYPSLVGFRSKKVFIEGDSLLREAIECVVFSEEQIVKEPSKADYILTYNDKIEDKNNKYIAIERSSNCVKNIESIKWNIAEQIMEKL